MRTSPTPSPSSTSMSVATAIRAGVATSAATLIVHAMSLGRDAALALAFGTTVAVDAFFLAMMVPIFMVTVAAGAYRNAIVPILERMIHLNGKDWAARLITRLMDGNLLIVGGVGLILAVLAPIYAPVLAGRLQAETVTLLTTLTWAVLPMALLSAYASLAEGPLQTLGHYFWPTLFRVAPLLGIATGAIFLGPTYGIFGACYGGAIGALIQITATAILLPRRSFGDAPFSTQDSHVTREIRQQFGLLSAGVALAYISPIIDQWMASFLGSGAVSTLSYANRLVVGAASLAASAMSPGLLPHFSRLKARGETSLINTHYAAAMRITWWGGLAMAGMMWILADPFVALLYEHGNFTRQDSVAVSSTVGWLCLQFPAMLAGVAGSILLSAVGLNKVFIPLSVLIATVNVLGNLALMPFFGLAGIALSTVLTYLVSLGAINVVLIRQSIIKPDLVLLRDLFISVGTAVALAAFLFMEEAKLSVVPTSQQLVLCTLAMGTYCGVAYIFTKKVFSAIRRNA